MRIALGLLTAVLLVFCVHTLATGDEAGGAPADGDAAANTEEIAELRARIEALEIESDYLRSREEALTKYLLLNIRRAEGLKALAAKARKEGFENNRIPAPSRVTLMAGLDGLAKSLLVDLPEVSSDEKNLLKKAKAHRKLNQLGGR